MKKIILSLIFYSIYSALMAQQVQWAKKYPKLGEYTSPRCIEASLSGDLAVAGDYNTPYSVAGAFVYKMDGAGNILWGDTLKYVNPSYDGWVAPRVTALSFNSAGKLFLGGNYFDTINIDGSNVVNVGPKNFFLIKYSAGGGIDWDLEYSNASLYDIYSDASGNTYITISFSGGPMLIFGQTFTSLEASDLLVLKLDAAGSLTWSKQIHGNVEGVKFRKAPSGNMFLLGSYADTLYYDGAGYPSIGGPFNEYFLLKMNASGTPIYHKAVWGSQQQKAHDLAVSADEKAMVTGASCWTNGCSALLKTYDAAGNLMADESVWGTTCDYGCGFDYNHIVMADPAGVWTMGHEQNTLVYGIPTDDWHNIGLTKYDFAGNVIMRDTFLLEQSGGDALAKDITADNSGNLYMTARLYGTAQFDTYTLTSGSSDPDFFVAKLSQTSTAAIPVAEPKLKFEIYPNPAENIISIDYACDSKNCVRLNVRNVLGQLVFSDVKDNKGSYSGKIDLSAQPQGLYFIEVDNGVKKEVKKLVLN